MMKDEEIIVIGSETLEMFRNLYRLAEDHALIARSLSQQLRREVKEIFNIDLSEGEWEMSLREGMLRRHG